MIKMLEAEEWLPETEILEAIGIRSTSCSHPFMKYLINNRNMGTLPALKYPIPSIIKK